eukprot:GFUD01038343.1.p1 GENE.GFUD01038343.1~~GFUD01038343.1.p1  ORF type:complete len:1287 (+),score=506.35 GFUD01038343.1:270-4130(+)
MSIQTTLSLFCCLLQMVAAQVDISGCCTHLKIETTGEASNHQGNRIGEYQLTGVLADRPIYKNVDKEEYLFYLQSKKKGLWMVGPTAGQFNGGLAHRGDTYCVEDVSSNQWKYTDGSAWHVDPSLRVSCLDQTVTPQCMYNDQTEFVGGDLPEVFGGGGVETSMESSANCIEECEKRSGCKYWTWVMGEKVNCFLKNSRVETVRKPKYVSGSIPKACTSTPPTPTQPPSTYTVCTYQNLDLQGGDLFTVVASDLDDCRQQCEEHVSCQLFTFDNREERGCYFKTDQVSVIANKNVVSGATAEICEDFILPHVTQKDEEPKYNENEVNGKFKITSLRWDEKLNDATSQEYQDLSNTIEDSLESMLRSERDLDEQAEFSVEVKKFRKGSVVCDFKVNYILKEAYIAIPFAIKPSNITDAMNKNFKFKKGILFQRFLIAAGSFNSSSPVDHCAAKGCSHKCDYDYDIEDYLCTCPRTLQLDNKGLNCITEEEASTQKSVDEATLDETDRIEETASDETKDQTTPIPEVKLIPETATEEKDPSEDETTLTPEVELLQETAGEETGSTEDATTLSPEVKFIQETENEETDPSEDETTLRPEIKLTLLPMNCLWSPWSDWTECSTSCGQGKKERQRSVVLPEKNGGFCPGRFKEFVECEGEDCEEDETVVENEDMTDAEIVDVEQTTVSLSDEESEENFGIKLTTETTEINDDVEQDSTVVNTKIEVVTTESFLEVGSGETTDVISEKEKTTIKNNIDVTTTSEEDLEIQVDDDQDEETRIMFPLTENDEISTTTASLDTNTLTTTNVVFPTEVPVLSVDIPVDVETEIAEEKTTVMSEIETVSENDEMKDETSGDTSDFETTTQQFNLAETTAMENNNEKELDGAESTTQRDIESDGSDINVDIPKTQTTTLKVDDNEAETSTRMEDRTDDPNSVNARAESETTTLKQTDMDVEIDSETDTLTQDDMDTNDETEYETTTHMDEQVDDIKNSESANELENTTNSKNQLDDISSSETTTPQADGEENDQNINVEYDTALNNDTESETTTAVNNTGEKMETEDIADMESKTDTATDSTAMEETKTVVDTVDDISTEKTPGFDAVNEGQMDVSNGVTKIPADTDEEIFSTINPNLNESTTVTVISIEESDGEITIVTTARPTIATDLGTEDVDITGEKNDEATTEKSKEEETTHIYEIDIATDSEIAVDVKTDITTTSPEVGDHEFRCKESAGADNENTDVPLECVLTNGEEEKTVFILIPREALGGDRDKLFDKNVKIVVKNFMIMERSPRALF